jgi:hypothetical protein
MAGLGNILGFVVPLVAQVIEENEPQIAAGVGKLFVSLTKKLTAKLTPASK